MKIGILKEGKVPIDRRVPFTPKQARELLDRFPGTQLAVQSSNIRCYTDQDYTNEGIEVTDDLADCDALFGVKEVPIDDLIPGKTYFFFSHTIKKQVYNKSLLQAILKKKIQLIDYEALTDNENKRIVAFGRWAGIVGAYNGIWTFGRRYRLFDLRRAQDCLDYEDLKTEYKKVQLPPINIVLTGGGRVAKGAIEVLLGTGLSRVTPADFLNNHFTYPVFTQLNPRDYHHHKEGKLFSRQDFFQNPGQFESDFLLFTKKADVLIASAFWSPNAPVLFERHEMMSRDFRIKVIADITCDIEGSIPSTKRPSTIDDPIYDYNPDDDCLERALSDEGNVTVMAIDNLPCELPRDASASFGNELLKKVIPHLVGEDSEGIIERATITKDGQLTKSFAYLQDYIETK